MTKRVRPEGTGAEKPTNAVRKAKKTAVSEQTLSTNEAQVAAASAAAAKRKKRLQQLVPPEVPEDAEFCYYFADGQAISGIVKQLMNLSTAVTLRCGPEHLRMMRSNDSRTILAVVTISNDRILRKGDFDECPNGFRFGLNLQELSLRATHGMTRNDSFMMYFKEENDRLYCEKKNNKADQVGRHRAIINAQHVEEKNYFGGDDEVPPEHCVNVPLEYFIDHCNSLVTAKCARIHIVCSGTGVIFQGRDDNNNEIMSIFLAKDIDTSVHPGPTLVTYRVGLKSVRALLLIKHTATERSLLQLKYDASRRTFLVHFPISDIGTMHIYLKNEFVDVDPASTS